MLFRLLSVRYTPVQVAQTNVAVGHERSHSEFVGQGDWFPIMFFGIPDIRRTFVRCDLAEEPKSVRLVSSLFVLARESQGALCGGTGIRFAPGQQIRFAQPEGPQRFALQGRAQNGTLDGLLQEGNCLSTAPRERIGVA